MGAELGRIQEVRVSPTAVGREGDDPQQGQQSVQLCVLALDGGPADDPLVRGLEHLEVAEEGPGLGHLLGLVEDDSVEVEPTDGDLRLH